MSSVQLFDDTGHVRNQVLPSGAVVGDLLYLTGAGWNLRTSVDQDISGMVANIDSSGRCVICVGNGITVWRGGNAPGQYLYEDVSNPAKLTIATGGKLVGQIKGLAGAISLGYEGDAMIMMGMQQSGGYIAQQGNANDLYTSSYTPGTWLTAFTINKVLSKSERLKIFFTMTRNHSDISRSMDYSIWKNGNLWRQFANNFTNEVQTPGFGDEIAISFMDLVVSDAGVNTIEIKTKSSVAPGPGLQFGVDQYDCTVFW